MAVTRGETLLVSFDLANPGAATNVFTTDLTVKGKSPALRLTVVPSTTSIVSLTHTDGTGDFTYAVNSGTALTADQVYAFDIPAVSGHDYNVQFTTSQTGNSAKVVLVMLQQVEA